VCARILWAAGRYPHGRAAAAILITAPCCRSAGKKQEFEGVEYTIEELTENR
jgi:hypothetical protein